MTRHLLSFALSTSLLACAAQDEPPILSHRFEAVELAAGEEVEMCGSWTLGNEEELWVDEVVFEGDEGWHHSNWFTASETQFEGPDGIWPCAERNFDEVAAAVGGGFLFAQSTQAKSDRQAFEPGAAIRLPPRTKVVAQLHALNATGEDLVTSVGIDVHTVHPEDVETPLLPMLMEYMALDLPPRQASSVSASCDFMPHTGGAPLDFDIHYVLPHYHDLGTGARLEMIGGDRDGEVVAEVGGALGETWGVTLSPPVSTSGASGLRFSCDYLNDRDESVGFGYGDQEMCFVFAFTSSKLRWAGIVQSELEATQKADRMDIEGECTLVGLPVWH